MTYTAEQLREESDQRKAEGQHYLALIFSGYADALEENARMKSILSDTRDQLQAHMTLDSATWEMKLERAEAELARLKEEQARATKIFADALTRWGAEKTELQSGLVKLREKIVCIEMDRDHARLDAKLERERADRNQEDAERYRWILHQAPITDFIFVFTKSKERHVSNAIDTARRK